MNKIEAFIAIKREVEGREKYLRGDCYKLALDLQTLFGGEIVKQVHLCYDGDIYIPIMAIAV